MRVKHPGKIKLIVVSKWTDTLLYSIYVAFIDIVFRGDQLVGWNIGDIRDGIPKRGAGTWIDCGRDMRVVLGKGIGSISAVGSSDNIQPFFIDTEIL